MAKPSFRNLVVGKEPELHVEASIVKYVVWCTYRQSQATLRSLVNAWHVRTAVCVFALGILRHALVVNTDHSFTTGQYIF